LRRPRRRWVKNIKTDLREIGWDGIDWIGLAQDRDQWTSRISTDNILSNMVKTSKLYFKISMFF
jgi:hypothetical protein